VPVATYSCLVAPLLVMLVGGSCKPEGRVSEPGEQHYDDKAAALASFEEPDRDKWAMPVKVVESLKIQPGMDVADIGAGSGYFTRRLATAAPNGTTYAVDVDADFKSYIESHRDQWHTPNIVTRLAVYEHPLLPVGSVDLVFISNTYSFLQDREGYFTAVHKALRPGGRLAVIDWRVAAECPRSLGCPKPNDRVDKSVAIEELARVGFTVLDDHDFLQYQYFMILGRTGDMRPSEPTPESTP
jgi:predicted methyltransferase